MSASASAATAAAEETPSLEPAGGLVLVTTAVSFAGVLAGLISAWGAGAGAMVLGVLAAAAAVLLAALVLALVQRQVPAGWLTLGCLTSLFAWGTWSAGGDNGPGVASLLVLMAVAGQLVGWRAPLAIGGAGLAALAAAAAMGREGVPTELLRFNETNRLLWLVIVLTGGALVLATGARALQQALETLRTRHRALSAGHEVAQARLQQQDALIRVAGQLAIATTLEAACELVAEHLAQERGRVGVFHREGGAALEPVPEGAPDSSLVATVWNGGSREVHRLRPEEVGELLGLPRLERLRGAPTSAVAAALGVPMGEAPDLLCLPCRAGDQTRAWLVVEGRNRPDQAADLQQVGLVLETAMQRIDMSRRQGRYLEHLLRAQSLASLGRITASIAHEVGNPAGTILLNAGVLRTALSSLWPAVDAFTALEGEFDVAGTPSARARPVLERCADDVVANAQRIKQIVDSVRRLARLDRGDVNEDIGPLELIRHAAAFARTLLEREGVRLAIVADPAVSPIHGNPGTLQLALVTLLHNLGRMEGPRPLAIRIHVHDDVAAGRAVLFDFESEGLGVPRAVREALAEPLDALDLGAADLTELQVVGNVVRRHGGHISFPTLGHTRLRLRLPAASGASRSPAGASGAA